MDKATRHDLKTDKFAEEVTHSIEYLGSHRQQTIRYGGAGLAVILLVVGGYSYWTYSKNQRQTALSAALRIRDGVVGAGQPGDPRPTFGSQFEKDNALRKAFEEVVAKHGSSNEAAVAHYQLGSQAADAGKLDDAAKHFAAAVTAGNADYASVSKLALADVLQAQKKTAEAERLLHEIIASPTILVSKEQAQFSLARMLVTSKPADAKKILEPLTKDPRPTIARNASQLMSEILPNQ